MRIARKLTLLAAMAVAATALMATTAYATNHEESVEVIEEATGEHCLPQCDLHATGEAKLSGHAFGFESTVSDCTVEFTGGVGEDGEGQVDTAHLENHPGSNLCTVTPCDLPWLVHVREYTDPGLGEVLHAEFCVDDEGTLRRCEVELPVTVDGLHDYESVFQGADEVEGTNHGNATNCELEGQFHLTGTDIELVH